MMFAKRLFKIVLLFAIGFLIGMVLIRLMRYL